MAKNTAKPRKHTYSEKAGEVPGTLYSCSLIIKVIHKWTKSDRKEYGDEA